MKRFALMLGILASFTLASSAWSLTPEETAAQTIIKNWFVAMQKHDVDKAGAYLAPTFVSVHTDGIVRDKAGELALIKNIGMEKHTLTDFQTVKTGCSWVVTFKDKGVEKIDNNMIAPGAALRMAVLQKINGQLQIFAYANLDSIK